MDSIMHLMMHLPADYEEECTKQGAIKRKRGVTSAADLMMLAMFHLHNGCSLMEMSEIAKLTKLGQMSDVAFMKRFEQCGDWFKAINAKIVREEIIGYQKPTWLDNRTAIAIDATDVAEKGRSGRIYRLHYALDLFQMNSVQYKITTNKTGESLCNFDLHQGQLVIADRGYARIKDIQYCESMDAEYLIRLRKNSFTVRDERNQEVDLPALLAKLGTGESLDLRAYATNLEKSRVPIRICATRKTTEAIKQTHQKLHRKESKKQIEISDEAKTFNEYIVLVTNLPDTVSAAEAFEAYRFRWQIEMCFKRLKSIMDFGELPKRREKSVVAWLNGKIMIALLIEKMISKSTFPPAEYSEQECMA